jgi:tetraacyldisaccharide 4'-kinase
LDADYVLMTAKDAVKCEHMKDNRLWVAEAEMCFSDPDFLPWLNTQLKAKSVQSHLH